MRPIKGRNKGSNTLPSTPVPELDTPHYMHSTRLWTYTIRVERGSRTVVFPVTYWNLATLRSVRRPCSRSPRRLRARRTPPPWVATRWKCTVPIPPCASTIHSNNRQATSRAITHTRASLSPKLFWRGRSRRRWSCLHCTTTAHTRAGVAKSHQRGWCIYKHFGAGSREGRQLRGGDSHHAPTRPRGAGGGATPGGGCPSRRAFRWHSQRSPEKK